MGYRIWDMGYGIWKIEYGKWNMEYGIWNMEYGIWDIEYGIWNMVGTGVSMFQVCMSYGGSMVSCPSSQMMGWGGVVEGVDYVAMGYEDGREGADGIWEMG